MPTPQPVIVTTFIGDPREHGWHRAYLEACGAVREARDVAVIDVRERPLLQAPADSYLSLLVRALRAATMQTEEGKESIREHDRAQHNDASMGLGISPCGPDSETARDAIFELIGQGPAGCFRWVWPSVDREQLRRWIADWLFLMADRRFPPGGMSTSPGGSPDAGPNLDSDERGQATSSSTRRFRSVP